MLKVYEPTKVVEQLFLALRALPGRIAVSLVQNDGCHIADLAYINDSGIVMAKQLPESATRAGFSPEALDANGRLKVIGQESVEAEEMSDVDYCCIAESNQSLTVCGGWPKGELQFIGGSVVLSPDNIRDLAARLNRHVAYLDKEGL